MDEKQKATDDALADERTDRDQDDAADESGDVAVDTTAASPDAKAEQLSGDPTAGMANRAGTHNEPGVSDEVRKG